MCALQAVFQSGRLNQWGDPPSGSGRWRRWYRAVFNSRGRLCLRLWLVNRLRWSAGDVDADACSGRRRSDGCRGRLWRGRCHRCRWRGARGLLASLLVDNFNSPSECSPIFGGLASGSKDKVGKDYKSEQQESQRAHGKNHPEVINFFLCLRSGSQGNLGGRSSVCKQHLVD